MASLIDFYPIESLNLPGIGELDCSGLVLIVGPNSSGKSRLLRDIHHRISGETKQLVVASEVRVKRLPYEELIAALAEAGYVSRFEDDGGSPHLRPMTTYAGSGQHASQVQINQIQSWHQVHRATEEKNRRKDEYLAYVGRFLVTALFLDHRLTALNQAGMIDFIGGPPQHDLHALHLNDAAKTQLASEIESSFGKAVWPDISRGTGVCLRVSDKREIPCAEDRLSPTKMDTYRTIETEGDGLKSYAATCVALLLGRRPLCLVDEPEMCLHPPQAYNLGRFIGSFGTSKETATLVATHSSHVLRGVLQVAPRLQIVRLTRVGNTFRAHRVPPEALETAMAKPTVRAESVLDGIFAQAVVIIEADGDRTVYQAVWETRASTLRLDIHFATVGGTGGIADTCNLYTALRIPVAVIADLDILTDLERLDRVLQSLGAPQPDALVTEAKRVLALVKALPPTISENEVRAQITAAIAGPLDWSQEHDSALRTTLRQISNQIDRMRRLKTPASLPFPNDIKEAMQRLVSQLHACGLFVVPVGELEEWLSEYGIKASKKNKWAWANEAALRIRQLGPQTGDVWDFMATVGTYLNSRYADLSS